MKKSERILDIGGLFLSGSLCLVGGVGDMHPERVETSGCWKYEEVGGWCSSEPRDGFESWKAISV